MTADDLAGLFAEPPPGPSQAVRYRQGIVMAFNPVTLENEVDVGGTVMTDLPLFGVGEALLLTPGSVVGVMSVVSDKGTSTWAIFGRLVTPNTPEAADATALLSSQIHAVSVATQESTTSTAYGDLATDGPEVQFNVGGTGRILVLITTQLEWTTTGYDGGLATIEMSGDFNTMAPTTADDTLRISAAGSFGSGLQGTYTASAVFAGLTPGLTTITMKYRSQFGAQMDFARRNLTVIAI